MVVIMSGGPAFPSHGSMGEVTHEGMTLRDYFAAKWLQGFIANPSLDDVDPARAARNAYRMADAMLKARSE